MYYKISSKDYYYVPDPYDTNHEVIVILSNKRNPVDCYSDFYYAYFEKELNPSIKNGEMYWTAKWCEENCFGAWLVGRDISAFADESDAMAFKLRWL